MRLPATADVVVIGGGVNGGAIAYYLARAGVCNLVVLEAANVGHGASSRGAGIIRTYYKDECEARLALLSLATFRNWRDEIGGTCGYTPTGFIWLVGDAGVRDLEATVATQRRIGAEVESPPLAEISKLQPHLDLDGVQAAAFEKDGGYGDPNAATQSLHGAAVRLGAKLYENVAVIALSARSGRITGVTTSVGSISAPVVILAGGAWSAALAASIGVQLPLIPTRMTTGTIRHRPFAKAPFTFIDAASDVFYRPTEVAGVAHISVRDARHNTELDFDQNWPDEAVSPDASLEGIARLRRRIPSLDASPLRAWVGVDGVTPDRRAIYGKIASVEGLILCVGGNYKGFKVAPAVGRCLAELVVSGGSLSVDLSPFDIARFSGSAEPPQLPAFSLSDVS